MVAKDDKPVHDLKLEMVGQAETIVPAGPTPTGRLFLSNNDQVLVIPVETVYFYPPHSDRPIDKLVETLKDALSRVLVAYDTMAGRLVVNTEENRLEIDRNRKGAQFTHYTSGLTIADLGDVTLPNAAFRSLVPTKFDATVVFEVPLLAIQITTFACGGYTVGVMMSHTVFDGPAAIEFFMNYAALARGEELVCTPIFDRTAMKARDPPTVTFDHPEYITLEQMEKGNPFSTTEAAEAEFVPLDVEPMKYVTKVFPFTPEMIDELKKRALEGGIIKKVSTFEVVAAHIWRSRTRAVDMNVEITNLLYAVDVRRRLVPPLPKHFAGNAVIAAYARDTPNAVREMSYVEAVQRIQEGIARITDEYIRSATDWGQIYKGLPALAGGFFLSAWWKMPFYDIDYGWGKPVYAGPIVTPLIEFVFLLSNGTQNGGLNLYIALEPAQMEKFEEFIKV